MEQQKNMAAQPPMTAQEQAEFAAWRADKARKEMEQARKHQRDRYTALVDQELADTIPQLIQLSDEIAAVKLAIYENWQTILALKAETIGVRPEGQYSHTFTSTDGCYRLTLGVYTVDSYRDTVDEGIGMVLDYLQSLATDDKSRALVRAVTKLLSRDAAGNIRASRVLQLRKMAAESGSEQFVEGVRIIEESYQPMTSKRYIKAQYRGNDGSWVSIPLNITECLDREQGASKS